MQKRIIKGGAHRNLVRGGVAERLANPAFKMASAAMADEGDLTDIHRPFHDASQTRKCLRSCYSLKMADFINTFE
jgi:hypothetical protein